MPALRDNLLSRWNPAHDAISWMEPPKRALEHLFNAHDDVRSQHAKIAGDNKLTALGKHDALRNHIARNVAPHLYYGGKAVETMRGKLEQAKARLLPPTPDKNDAAAAIVRSDLRRALLAMTPNGRKGFLLSPTCDLEFYVAALEAPLTLSGVSDDLRSQIVDAAIKRANPNRVAELDAISEAVDVVAAAHGVASNITRMAADFPNEPAFHKFVETSLGDRAYRIRDQVASEFSGFGG